MDLKLRDQVVLVTGGSDGLGAAVAGRLVEEGARVALCARQPDRLAAVEARLTAQGGDVLAVPADVTVPGDLERFVALAAERWGHVDGLVNNAGQSAARLFDAVTDDDWQADLDLKLHAAVRAARLALPHLRAAGGGSIVNVLAIAARTPGAGSMPTSVSRAAGLAFTKALSKEVGAAKVRVNALLVGLVESGQWERRAAEQEVGVDELYAQLARERPIPLGRVGRAGEFADVAAFLLSPRASYVTGTAINVDGGLSDVV